MRRRKEFKEKDPENAVMARNASTSKQLVRLMHFPLPLLSTLLRIWSITKVLCYSLTLFTVAFAYYCFFP